MSHHLREKAWRAYAKFLEDECAKLQSYASVRGYICPEKDVRKGFELRDALRLDKSWEPEEVVPPNPDRAPREDNHIPPTYQACAVCGTARSGIGMCPRCDPPLESEDGCSSYGFQPGRAMVFCRLALGHDGECEMRADDEEEPPQPIGFPVPEDEVQIGISNAEEAALTAAGLDEVAPALSPVKAMFEDHTRQLRELEARLDRLTALVNRRLHGLGC